MGWARVVGSLKIQVSIVEYRLFYRALLQKRPKILRRLLIEAHMTHAGISDMPHLLGAYIKSDWILAQDLPFGKESLRVLLRRHLSLPGQSSVSRQPLGVRVH